VDSEHRPGDTAAEQCTQLRIAGRIFLLPSRALEQRSFLRAMAREGGTVHALRLLSLAYPERNEGEELIEAAFGQETWGDSLAPLQRDYVKCWLAYLRARFSQCDMDGTADPQT